MAAEEKNEIKDMAEDDLIMSTLVLEKQSEMNAVMGLLTQNN